MGRDAKAGDRDNPLDLDWVTFVNTVTHKRIRELLLRCSCRVFRSDGKLVIEGPQSIMRELGKYKDIYKKLILTYIADRKILEDSTNYA